MHTSTTKPENTPTHTEFLFDDDDGMPMQRLAVLRTLVIVDCKCLVHLHQGLEHLNRLEDLVIVNCENLDLVIATGGEMDVLQLFAIENVPKLVALPQWLQESSDTLSQIMIRDCPNFTTVRMQNLRFLQKLEISDCPQLTSLPKLTSSLKQIAIWQCPELIRRCQRETGEDWHKITHVPYIYLDNIRI